MRSERVCVIMATRNEAKMGKLWPDASQVASEPCVSLATLLMRVSLVPHADGIPD